MDYVRASTIAEPKLPPLMFGATLMAMPYLPRPSIYTMKVIIPKHGGAGDEGYEGMQSSYRMVDELK